MKWTGALIPSFYGVPSRVEVLLHKPRLHAGISWLQPLLLLLAVAIAVKADQYSDFTYSTDGTNVTITGYTGTNSNVVIPDTISDLPVTGIGNGAFTNYCFQLSSVTIPDSVTSIGNFAFYYCIGMNSVTMGNNVSNIGSGAFEACWSLTNFTIPDSVTSIGDSVFAYSGLTSVTIGNGVTSIGASAFSACSLTSVTIGNGVISIGASAFSYCGNLRSVSIPSSVTNIGNEAFLRCDSLTAITVDADNSAFSSLDGVLFDRSQTTLILFPGGKTGSYTVPNGVTSIADYAFYWCRGLTNATIGNSVTNIGASAFFACGLTSVTIGNGVTSIGDRAFVGNTSLRSVTIGNSVNSIGYWAFGNCPSAGVYFQGNAPVVDPTAFSVDSNLTVYYLPGTTGWDQWVSPPPAVLWNPQAQTSDANFGVRTNRFGFTITGTTNIPIVVEATTNLAGAPWTMLQSCTLTNGLVYFSDPQWTNYPSRFYRIRSP